MKKMIDNIKDTRLRHFTVKHSDPTEITMKAFALVQSIIGQLIAKTLW
jgi:hypothetical protein